LSSLVVEDVADEGERILVGARTSDNLVRALGPASARRELAPGAALSCTLIAVVKLRYSDGRPNASMIADREGAVVAYVKVAERREQIVAAALRALVRDGVDRTTMRTVAAEAKVSLSTLHYVFQSKEGLFRAVLEEIIQEISQDLEFLRSPGLSMSETLEKAIRHSWARMAAKGPGLQILQYELLSYALRTPNLADMARWQYDEYSRVVATWCRAAAEDAGETCAVGFDALARAIVALMDGLVLQRLATQPDTARTAQDVEHAVAMITAFAAPSGPQADQRRTAASGPSPS
jgi:AcrR family transcriptional regulator